MTGIDAEGIDLAAAMTVRVFFPGAAGRRRRVAKNAGGPCESQDVRQIEVEI